MSELTRSDRELLDQMRFRESGDHGHPCWFIKLPGDRWQLIVWTMMNSWGRSPFIKRGRTVTKLEVLGLIYTPAGSSPPEPFNSYRGFPVKLTADGYRALDGAE